MTEEILFINSTSSVSGSAIQSWPCRGELTSVQFRIARKHYFNACNSREFDKQVKTFTQNNMLFTTKKLTVFKNKQTWVTFFYSSCGAKLPCWIKLVEVNLSHWWRCECVTEVKCLRAQGTLLEFQHMPP